MTLVHLRNQLLRTYPWFTFILDNLLFAMWTAGMQSCARQCILYLCGKSCSNVAILFYDWKVHEAKDAYTNIKQFVCSAVQYKIITQSAVIPVVPCKSEETTAKNHSDINLYIHQISAQFLHLKHRNPIRNSVLYLCNSRLCKSKLVTCNIAAQTRWMQHLSIRHITNSDIQFFVHLNFHSFVTYAIIISKIWVVKLSF